MVMPLSRPQFLEEVCSLARKRLKQEQIDKYGLFRVDSRYNNFQNDPDGSKRYNILSSFTNLKDCIREMRDDTTPLIIENREEIPLKPLNDYVDRLYIDLKQMLEGFIQRDGNTIKVENIWIKGRRIIGIL